MKAEDAPDISVAKRMAAAGCPRRADLYFARHGQTEANVERRSPAQGHAADRLGVAQASPGRAAS